MLFEKNNLFANFFELDNKITCLISFKNLLSEIIVKPAEQRIRDNDKIKEIVELQDKYYKKNKCFNFLGLINIHCCKEDKTNYLVDGQHRYYAIEQLYQQNYNEYIRIEIIKINTIEELKFNYNMINKNTELPIFPESINKKIPEKIAEYFFDNYPDVWISKGRPKRPYIHRNRFQEAIAYIVEKFEERLENKKSSEEIKQIIIKKNNKMKEWKIKTYIDTIRKIKKWPEYKEKSDKLNFWLGMYCETSEEYIYEWVKDIIKDETGLILKKRKRKRKKNIPKTLKKEVWKKYIGNKIKDLCFCCRINTINFMDNWSCGHIISEKNGGKTNINNLRPICTPCNLAMGTKNLYIFRDNHYS